MSTNMQNITTKTTNTPAAASGKAGGGLGVNLSSGMESAVTAALSLLEQILCDINNTELRQSRRMASSMQEASVYSANSLIENGQEQFVDAIAEGLGAIGGSLLTVGIMKYGDSIDPTDTELAKLKQEESGIQNIQKEIPKTANAAVNEQEAPVYGPDTEAVAKAKADRAEALNKKIEELKGQKSFTHRDGNALKVSDEDAELLKTMDQKQAKALNDHLEGRLDKIAEQRTGLSRAQSEHRSRYSTYGQAAGQAGSGAGKTVGAFTKQAQAEDQADAQLSNTAVQGMQAILSQLVKTANDALSQAQQTIQTFATISNGNKFQG